VPLNDENGNPVAGKTINTINYTEPHNNADGTAIVNGFVSLVYSDGSTTIVTDNVDTIYFLITAEKFQPRRF
jgi:hypothetical protein